MPKHSEKNRIVAFSLFLVGLVFLVESIVLGYVISQIPAHMLGATISIAWVYTTIKFFAGLLALYAGLELIKEK